MHPGKLTLALAISSVLVLACGGGGSDSPTEPDLTQAEAEATAEVCHEAQKKIDVRLSKLKHHFDHGDWLIGPEICDGQDNDCDSHIDEGGVCDG